MRQPHVALACTWHPPGDIRVFSRLAAGLAQRGWRVSLLAPELPPIPAMPDGVQYYPGPVVKGYLSRLRQAGRLLPRLRELEPDLVLFPDPELFPTALRYRRAVGAAVVFDRHENFEQGRVQARGKPLAWLLSSVYIPYERYATGIADGVIVVLEEMIKNVHPQANAVVAHNYPTRAVIDQLAGEPSPGTKPYTCVHLGTIEPIRGAWELLHVARELARNRRRADFTLMLGGSFAPGLLEEMSNYSAQHGLQDSVTLVPHKLPHGEVVDLLRASRIGLCPFLDNKIATIGLQNKLLEYMGAGLPVVTSPTTMNARIVRDSGCGVLLWADQAKEIADTIEAWLDEPQRAGELGARGQRYVKDHLVWERELDKLEPWLRELATRERRHTPHTA